MHLIGIEIINGEQSVIKNLKKGWYPFVFCDSLNIAPDCDKKYDFEKYRNFYTKDNISPKISISCIVGQNGSGKSTLLDILFRIINNFSYCLDEKLCNVDYAKGFHAKLYYSINCEVTENKKKKLIEKIGFIDSNSMNDSIDIKIKFPDTPDLISIKQKNSIPVSFLENFFYTIVTNYSIYSFNPDDYFLDNEEENFYVQRIFSKNDAYVTPIVILPYRDENGIIQIDNERHLAVQRIIAMSIFFYKKYNALLVDDQKPFSVKYNLIKDYEKTKRDNISILDEIDQINILVDIWKGFIEKKYKINKTLNGSEKLYNLAIFYLAYKTRKILDNYGFLYEAGVSEEKNTEEIINNLTLDETKKWNKSKEQKYSEFFIETLINDASFMTLKLRQTLFFIQNPYTDIENGEIIIDKVFTDQLESIDNTFLQLPPPFYSYDLYFDNSKNNTKEGYNLSKLSSGQKQILYNLSYVLYHIKNLDTKDDKCTQQNINAYPVYQNILMVFDEAELFLHPELQRNFINTLLKAIYNCNFTKIKNIHIIFATHSPYLLSDVLNNNVLVLEDGTRKTNIIEQTFGANIYSLLNNQFFLEGGTGAFSQSVIKSIIEKANENQPIIKKEDYDYYKLIIDNIGEPFLRNSLQYLFTRFNIQEN